MVPGILTARASSECVKNIHGVPLSPASCTNGSQEALLSGEVDSYDTMGRVLDNSQCTPQNCASGKFPIQYSYDLLGDILTGTDGMGVTLSEAYNRSQRLTGLTSSLSDSNHPGALLSLAHFNAAGSLTSETFGNGINETRAYDSRLRLSSITDGAVYSLSIPASGGYAPNSDILAANDFANGNWTYTYDDFNRVLGSNKSSGQEVYSYDYDRFGNRWHQNGPHTMMLSFSGNNNRMDSYPYDAAGNLLNDGTTAYTYDAENRIITAVNSISGTSTYLYDASGQRVRKTTGGATVDFLYDLGAHPFTEVNSAGGWNRGEIYAQARHVGTYSGGTTGTMTFTYADWLGTERVRTTIAGAGCETITSLPYGDNQVISGSCGDPSPMHLTGKPRDTETGLDDFGARYYVSLQGRWLTPDWSARQEAVPYGVIGNPQSLDLYSYLGDNPVNLTDPDGHADPGQQKRGDPGPEAVQSEQDAAKMSRDFAAASQAPVDPNHVMVVDLDKDIETQASSNTGIAGPQTDVTLHVADSQTLQPVTNKEFTIQFVESHLGGPEITASQSKETGNQTTDQIRAGPAGGGKTAEIILLDGKRVPTVTVQNGVQVKSMMVIVTKSTPTSSQWDGKTFTQNPNQ